MTSYETDWSTQMMKVMPIDGNETVVVLLYRISRDRTGDSMDDWTSPQEREVSFEWTQNDDPTLEYCRDAMDNRETTDGNGTENRRDNIEQSIESH